MYKWIISCVFFASSFTSSFANQAAIQAVQNPVLEEQLFIARDPKTNRQQFRKAMQKIGSLIAIDIAKNLKIKEVGITTILDKEAKHQLVKDQIVLVTVLRAGLPLMNGMLKVFPNAEVGFIAMKRNEKTLEPTVFYQGMPSLKGKTVIISDPMIATGGSMLDAVKIVESLEAKKVIVAGAFCTEVGLNKIKAHNADIEIYQGVIDPVLNEVGYIVPGLGDAGDRAFGVKVD